MPGSSTERQRVEKCESCRYWVVFPDSSNYGNCCRYAPVVGLPDVDQSVLTVWPNVGWDDWCGEYKPGGGNGGGVVIPSSAWPNYTFTGVAMPSTTSLST